MSVCLLSNHNANNRLTFQEFIYLPYLTMSYKIPGSKKIYYEVTKKPLICSLFATKQQICCLVS